MESRVQLEKVTKDFGTTRALNDVNLAIFGGEVHGLVGENGAGKSTLAKVIAGDILPSSGRIMVNGAPVPKLTPGLARKMGIAIVHQWGDLVPTLTVEENIFLGNEIRGRNGILRKAEMRRTATTVLKELGAEVDPAMLADLISPAYRQIVAISKALILKCRFLIIDEGGISLDKNEVTLLFSVLRELRTRGVTILYISHLLDNVIELSDRITVLRNGNVIQTVDAKDVTTEQLSLMVVGHEVGLSRKAYHGKIESTSARLELQNLTWERKNERRGFSLMARPGEIMGITGPEGAGKTELLRTILGLMPRTRGSIFLNGKDVKKLTPHAMLKIGVAYVPEDRFKEGLLLKRSIEENVSLANLAFSTRLFLDRKALRRIAKEKVGSLKTKMSSVSDQVRYLSGGNQQKVMIAKWLEEKYELFLLDEPYKGIDIGAKEDINDAIRALAAEGRSIIVATTEFSDILGLVDSLLVVVNRQIVAQLSGDQITSQEIIRYYQAAVG